MTLKFTFFYKNANIDYFLGLLLQLARHFELESCVESSDEILAFYVSGENLSDFASACEREIPLSLYFRLKNAELCEKPTNLKGINLVNIAKDLARIFSISEINAIKNPSDSRFCDIFGNVSTEIFWRDSSQKNGESKKIASQDSLQNVLQNLCDLLKNGREITLDTSKGAITLFTKNSDSQSKNFDFILANDISSISLYTRASQDELNALASFEKPLISLAIKEVFIKEVGAKNALFILPYDIILCCISSILLDYETPFLYLKKLDSVECDLSYKSAYNDNFFEIIIGQKGYFLQKKFLDSRESKISNLSQFLDFNFADLKAHESKSDLSHDSQNNDIFIAYISTANPTLLANLGDKIQLIKIAFDKNPKNILAKIALLENGDKLIANFAREFDSRYKAIQSLDSTPQMSQNITDIFECAAMILGAECDKNAIFDFARDYLRDIGPKIDFKNTKREDALFYDESRTIRSIMSFALAGSENEVIAYGLLESLVDYLVLIFRDAQSKFCIKSVGIIGDMFANKIFFDTITKKIPADFNLVFPKYLDFRV